QAMADQPPTQVEHYAIDFTRLLYMLYQDLELQLTRSDTKSQLILSTNAVIAAAVTSFGLRDLRVDSAAPADLFMVASYGVMFFCLAVSIYYALVAAFPQHKVISSHP